jgi:surface glycoprotein (TIGR04207 family)
MSKESRQAVRAVFLAAIMVISVFAAGIAFSGSAAANHGDNSIIVVDDDFTTTNETHKNSLADAVSAASSGDTIRVRSGTYTNSQGLTVDVSNVDITAAENTNPTLSVEPDSVSGTAAIDITADGVTISGLTIERISAASDNRTLAGHAQGISVQASDVVIENNELIGSLNADGGTPDEFDGIVVFDPYNSGDGGTTENVSISNNDVSGFDTGYVTTVFYSLSSIVRDVSFANNNATNNRIGFAAKAHKGSISGVSGSGNDFTGNDQESIVFSPESYQGYSGLQSIPATAVNFDGPVLVEDGDSIQTAVNVAGDGATVSVGSGVYREQIVISSQSGLTISGEGDSTIIESPNSADLNTIGLEENSARDPEIKKRSIRTPVAVLGSSAIKLSDIQVDGRNQGAGGQAFFGIYVENSSGSIVDTNVVNATGGGNSSPTGNQFIDAIRVQNSDDEDRQFAIKNVSVEKFNKNGITAQSVGDGNLSVDVTGSTVIGAGPTDATAQNGISLTDVSATVTDNTVVNLSYTKDGANSGYISTTSISDSEFTGNTLRDEVPSEGAPTGIYLTGSDDVTFAGNTIEGTAFGIFPNSGASDTEIESNTLRGQDTAILLSGSDDESIRSNTFEDNTRHLRDYDAETNLQELVANNTFDTAAYAEGGQQFLYSSIDDAVNGDRLADGGASAGDTIIVTSGTGTYEESIEVSKPDLTIRGEGSPVIDGRIDIPVDGTTIEDLTVRDGDPSGSDEVEAIFVGNANGFDDTSENIVIRDVTIEDVHPHGINGKAVEGIHAKHYDAGENIDGLVISNVTIRNITQPTWGADGIKLQAGIRDVSINNSTTIEDIEGSWAYGVVATPSGQESGVPENVDIERNTITNITATTYDGVGVGIDGSDDNGFANPEEVTVSRNNLENNDIAVLNKNDSGLVDAGENWWGSEDGPNAEPGNDAQGQVATAPFLTVPYQQLESTDDGTPRQFATELELTGGVNTIAFPAPSERTLNESLDLDNVDNVLVYDNTESSWEPAGNPTPDALDVYVVIVDEGETASLVMEFDNDFDADDTQLSTAEVSGGWNLVSPSQAADTADGAYATRNAEIGLTSENPFQSPHRQPFDADNAEFSPYRGYWTFVDEDDGPSTVGSSNFEGLTLLDYLENVNLPPEDE